MTITAVISAGLQIASASADVGHYSASGWLLHDRSVSVIGFYCADVVCEQNARPLRDSLQFEGARNQRILRQVPRLSHDWSVVLNCKVTNNHLTDCRLAEQAHNTPIDDFDAVAFAQRLDLTRTDSPPPRAIVTIAYEVGNCPSWMCTATPAPVPSLDTARPRRIRPSDR